jgi:hypothetical protein
MKKENLKQIWVAFKIWVIAIAANTLLGSLYLSGHLDKELIYSGLFYGSIFSLPIFIILLIVINHCVARRKNGLQLFRYVFIFGLLLTVIFSALFLFMLGGLIPTGLLFIAVLSGIAGITSQYGSMFRLADYDKHLEKFLLHED